MRGGADGRRAGLAALGGTLVEEFPAVRRTTSCGKRFLDAAILLNKKTCTAHWRDVSLRRTGLVVARRFAMAICVDLMLGNSVDWAGRCAWLFLVGTLLVP